MIGVKAAWQALYASGLPVQPVHVGFLDSELTRDPSGRVPWEFDDVTFIGDPATQPVPEAISTGYRHADGTLGILAGDGQNGGIAGIDSPLGSRLMVSHSVLNGPAGPGQSSKWTATNGLTYTDDALLKTLDQIESGATVISGSWGGSSVTASNAGAAAMWKAFFAQMADEHPQVLFVYAAGNYNTALDGSNYFPGGIPAPNVITVGNIDNDGGRHSGAAAGSDGVLPGSGGEITLGAPGDRAVWGTGLDGQVVHSNGGTSSATPMVSATAALIRSVDPSLSAADIKAIIAETAAQGDSEVGGRTLRVDLAVRKAIEGVRARFTPPLGELTDAQIEAATAFCQIDVSSQVQESLTVPAPGDRWSVTAGIAQSVRPGRMVELSLVAAGLRPTNGTQAVIAGGTSAGWTLLVSARGTWIIVTRHDNGYWRRLRLLNSAVTPTPEPTAAATNVPTPAPAPTTGGDTYDCSNPPQPGTIDYVKWSLHCKSIGS